MPDTDYIKNDLARGSYDLGCRLLEAARFPPLLDTAVRGCVDDGDRFVSFLIDEGDSVAQGNSRVDVARGVDCGFWTYAQPVRQDVLDTPYGSECIARLQNGLAVSGCRSSLYTPDQLRTIRVAPLPQTKDVRYLLVSPESSFSLDAIPVQGRLLSEVIFNTSTYLYAVELIQERILQHSCTAQMAEGK